MLEISKDNGRILLRGRFDSSQAHVARTVFDEVHEPSVVDFTEVDYISSAGLSVLLATQKRLKDAGAEGLRLVQLNRHVRQVFQLAGLHMVFDIEDEPPG